MTRPQDDAARGSTQGRMMRANRRSASGAVVSQAASTLVGMGLLFDLASVPATPVPVLRRLYE